MRRSSWGHVVTLFVILTGWAAPASAEPVAAKNDAVRDFVLNEVKKDGEDPSTTYYAAAKIPETDMTVVYLSGDGYCGSGGCTLIILKNEGASLKLVNSVTVSWPPIIALNSKSHGVPDLGVGIKGGFAALPFDGRQYAENPTVPPARKLKDSAGAVLIKSVDGVRPVAE